MPKFGKKSRSRMKGVHPRLVNVLNEVVKIYDVTILEGVRSKERQLELYEKGATKVKDSKHMHGLAIDVCPYPVDWEDTKRFFYMAGIVMAIAKQQGVTIRWGGDWNRDTKFTGKPSSKASDPRQTFNDYPHLELVV